MVDGKADEPPSNLSCGAVIYMPSIVGLSPETWSHCTLTVLRHGGIPTYRVSSQVSVTGACCSDLASLSSSFVSSSFVFSDWWDLKSDNDNVRTCVGS